MWLKIIVSVLPAVVIGLPLDDWLDEHLYAPVPVAVMLMAAPAAPSAVTGTPMASGEEKPNRGFRIKSILSARRGSSMMPSYALPV